jgi:hypothetical protein
VPAPRRKPLWIAAAVTASILAVTAWLTVSHPAGETPRSAALANADMLRSPVAGGHQGALKGQEAGAGPITGQATAPSVPSAHLSPIAHHKRASAGHSAARQSSSAPQLASPLSVYSNPLRSVSGLIPERIDMGVDFGGAGPVYALGDAVITNATADSGGWPGGGWITYRLTSGPDAGLQVYVAEDVTPAVQVGQQVSSSTVIANMFNGGDGIETGWAESDGATAESESPAAGGIGGAGPFPTMVGLNFEELLQSLGVPAANNRDQAAYGVLPANYPTSWS